MGGDVARNQALKISRLFHERIKTMVEIKLWTDLPVVKMKDIFSADIHRIHFLDNCYRLVLDMKGEMSFITIVNV